MLHQIFLIYVRPDTEIMQRVRSSLHDAGLSIWVDETLEPGTPEWEQESQIAAQTASCCVVILSPDANGFPFFDKQLSQAQSNGLRVFPIIGRGDEWSAIPKAFIKTQMIDVRANHEARMQRCIELIREYLNIT